MSGNVLSYHICVVYWKFLEYLEVSSPRVGGESKVLKSLTSEASEQQDSAKKIVAFTSGDKAWSVDGHGHCGDILTGNVSLFLTVGKHPSLPTRI